jgi:2-polyprenyl-6-methoxyphenol hydroxylase-like FAD-dependent oxidoreductase
MEMRRYQMADRSGEIVLDVDFTRAMEEFGPSYMTSHGDLVEVLRGACGELPVRLGTTASELRQSEREVEVKLSDGAVESFDLVCGCDGIHSWTREAVFGEQPTFDTKWVGWTWWGRAGIFPPEVVREYWLRGAFFGAYSVPGKSTFVAAAPISAIPPDPKVAEGEVLGRLRTVLRDLVDRLPEVRAALEEAHDLWPWPLSDVRSRELRRGRVVLCGDAGIAFLPTAGLGASTAMRSAAALADELSHADADRVGTALDAYAKRVRPTAERNQRDSRRLARLMLVKNRIVARLRDELIGHLPASSATNQIADAMRRPM